MTIVEYAKIIEDVFHESMILLDKKDFNGSLTKVTNIIKSIKKVLNERPWGSSYNYESFLIWGIIYKSINDLLDITQITIDNEWLKDKIKVERVWIKLIDCKERTLFVQGFFSKELSDFMFFTLQNLENIFKYKFGDSYCMSIELIYDPICSICGKDMRTCNHIKNKIYNANLCKIIRKNVKIRAFNLVEKPEDYRCRLWPWSLDKIKTDNGEKDYPYILTLTLFTVDDFLNDAKPDFEEYLKKKYTKLYSS